MSSAGFDTNFDTNCAGSQDFQAADTHAPPCQLITFSQPQALRSAARRRRRGWFRRNL